MPPVAAAVKLPVPVIAPLSVVLRADKVSVAAPVVVKVCRVYPAARLVPAVIVPPVPAEGPR